MCPAWPVALQALSNRLLKRLDNTMLSNSHRPSTFYLRRDNLSRKKGLIATNLELHSTCVADILSATYCLATSAPSILPTGTITSPCKPPSRNLSWLTRVCASSSGSRPLVLRTSGLETSSMGPPSQCAP